MRFFFASLFLVACSSSQPPGPPPVVSPPVIACTPPSDAGACADGGDPFATDAAACDAGAAQYVADPCALPPSVCADGRWAAYFDNGTCGADGKCQLVTKYHYCDTGCLNGDCIFNGPTAAGRGF